MMHEYEPEFLASGTRLGTWWVPEETDLNHAGNLDSLPERRETGILATATDGEWGLLIATQLDAEDRSSSGLMQRELVQRHLMWGKTQDSATSLFDGTLTTSTTDYKTYAHTVWRGSWHVDSQTDWFFETDHVENICIEIAAAGPWGDMPPGQGQKHNLYLQWDYEQGVFERPKPVIHEAKVNAADVQLETAVLGHHSGRRLEFELGTYVRVRDEVEVGRILEKWVEPLHDLIGMFWLKNPGIVSVSVQRAASLGSSKICYSGRFAPVEARTVLDSRHRFAPFTTVEGLAKCGYSFDDLLTGYWDCRQRGYGRAIQRLNESQDSHLDHSLDARMLSATMSLESYERARTGRTGTIDIAKAADNLVDTAGLIGAEIRDIWAARGGQLFKNSVARIRSEYLTHEQSGARLKARSDSELSDHYWHHVALQWLLRRRFLAVIGIQESTADHLVADSLAYREEIRVMWDHYAGS
ncbi:MAG: hypothetical protein OXH28_06660 [bacterium]|nr:hypothetical protein [bacterium]